MKSSRFSLTCGRGTESAQAAPVCSKCKTLARRGSGTRGWTPAALQTAVRPQCRTWRGGPRLLSLLLPKVPSAIVGLNILYFQFLVINTLEINRYGKNFTLISSRTWSTVKLGADWLLRLNLCEGRENFFFEKRNKERKKKRHPDDSFYTVLLNRWCYIQAHPHSKWACMSQWKTQQFLLFFHESPCHPAVVIIDAAGNDFRC